MKTDRDELRTMYHGLFSAEAPDPAIYIRAATCLTIRCSLAFLPYIYHYRQIVIGRILLSVKAAFGIPYIA